VPITPLADSLKIVFQLKRGDFYHYDTKGLKTMFLKQILKNTLCFIGILSSVLAATAQPCKEVVGYYPTWRWYERNGLVRPATIHYQKYTTLVYAFFAPNPIGTIMATDDYANQNVLKGVFDPAQGSFLPNTSLIDLAHQNGVKVTFSIGGERNSEHFTTIAADSAKRNAFAVSCRALLELYNADGIDLDWEHPGDTSRFGRLIDYQNLPLLCQAVRTQLNALGQMTGKTYQISLAVGSAPHHMQHIDWQQLIPIIDRFHLMTYGFFGYYDPLTRFNTPLYTPTQVFNGQLSVDAAIRALIETYRVPADKILGGLAFYGQALKTQGAPAPFVGYTGYDTQNFPAEDGQPTYNQILDKLSLFDAHVDTTTRTPYLTGKNGLNTYITYDDESSMAQKAKYFLDKGLRGTFLWEIAGDYLETAPNSGIIWKTPLLDTVNAVFCGRVVVAPCVAPTHLTTTPLLQNAQLRCDAVNGATAYIFDYRKRNTATWTSANNVDNVLIINLLDSCTEYEYRVRTVCSENRLSDYSITMPFKTMGCETACNAPSGLTIGRNLNNLSLNWNALASAQYKLQWRLASETDWNTIQINTNSYTLQNILNCTAYRFRLASVCNGLSSVNSLETPFFTGSCPTCDPPPTVTLNTTQNSATLNWDAIASALRYQLRYRMVGASNWTTISVTNPTYSINNLNICARYEFSVQSICTTGAGIFSANQTFVTTGCANRETDTTQCAKPKTFYFGVDYLPLGELKIGQGRIFPIFGQSTDAYIPQNRVKWAISMVHAAHLFKNIAKIDGFDANYLWASALMESRCGCDGAMQVAGNQAFPLFFNTTTQPNGCYQIENTSGYAQLSQMYPLRFPQGQQPALVAYDHFTTASIANVYNNLIVLRYWEASKGWQVKDFLRTSADPQAFIRLMAAAHRGGAWQASFEQIFKNDRRNALVSNNLSSYFSSNSTISEHQKRISDAVKLLNNSTTSLEILSTANNPSTGLPYNYYDNYYDTQVRWNDIEDYISDIRKLYYAVNMNIVKKKVRTKFNSINNGQPISFRYQLGAVLDELLLNLPADDPTTAITTTYGCIAAAPVDTTLICAVPENLTATVLQDKMQLQWSATAPQYSIYYKTPADTNWLSATKRANELNVYYSYLQRCKTYKFKVKALCSNRESAFSAESSFQVPCSTSQLVRQVSTNIFEIAPNPSDLLQISFELESHSEQNTLEIGNLQGQVLKTISLGALPKGFHELTIPESIGLEAGFYWITLKMNQSRLVKKWLKE
jgi:chitinase